MSLTDEQPLRPVYASPELTEADPTAEIPHIHANWDMDFGANLTISATDDPQQFEVCLNISDHVKKNGIMVHSATKGQVFEFGRMLHTVISGGQAYSDLTEDGHSAQHCGETPWCPGCLTAEVRTLRDQVDGEAWERLNAELAQANAKLAAAWQAVGDLTADRPSVLEDARRILAEAIGEPATVPAAPVPKRSLLEEFPELANVRVTFDPRRYTAPHTVRGTRASGPDRQHPAHNGQTCKEYDAAEAAAAPAEPAPAGLLTAAEPTETCCHWDLICAKPIDPRSHILCTEHHEALICNRATPTSPAGTDAGGEQVPA